MKKHIIGLSLFSFIVSAAAVIYAVFNVSEIVQVSEVVSTPQYISGERNYCKTKRESKINSIEINQAIFNAKTKQFDLELTVQKNDSWTALHFFSKDNQGTRYVQTTPIPNKLAQNGKLNFQTSSYTWLNNLKSYENLYVIAEPSFKTADYNENFQPKFDVAKARAITIDYGK